MVNPTPGGSHFRAKVGPLYTPISTGWILTKLRDFSEKKKKRLPKQINATMFDQFRAERSSEVSARTLYHEGTICKTFLYWCVSRGLLKQNWIHVVSREDAERTKTGESRKIPIHPELRKLLKKRTATPGPWYFTAEPSNRYPAGDHWINPKKLNERFLGVAERVGLHTGRDALGFTLHSLRHFFETHCVNQGTPQRVIDTWMGHQSDRSMAAVYYHLSDEDSQAFMQRVEFALPSTESAD